MKRIIGTRKLADEVTVPVYQDDSGRQFLIDDEGQVIYGVWMLMEEPAVLDPVRE